MIIKILFWFAVTVGLIACAMTVIMFIKDIKESLKKDKEYKNRQ